ncbi:MAG: hypothetical protein WCP69_15200 [Bacteroidota bacterium]
MASTSETGHSKNVSNFDELVSFVVGYGTSYNPSKASLKLTALQTLSTNAKSELLAAKVAETARNNAANSREIAFKSLKKLSTRIINALDSTDATKQTVADAITVNHKIQGSRANTKKTVVDTQIESEPNVTPTIEHKQISVSQQSFDSLIDNFSKLIQIVSTETLYAPNEADLKATALNTLLSNLKTANALVVSTTTTYSNAILTRNNTFYQTSTGLIDIALDVKKYVKSVFGATSPQYKQISNIQFRKSKI